MKEFFKNSKKMQFRRLSLRKKMTDAERLVWHVVRGNRLGYKFKRQYSIGPYIVDFFCSELNLIMEIDGWVHGESQIVRRDLKRESYLRSLNFNIRRYTNEQVLNNPEVLYNDLKNFCDNLKTNFTPPLSSAKRGEEEEFVGLRNNKKSRHSRIFYLTNDQESV